ncbi:MAG TPA: DUF4124 domain-containing protein [Burkholderiaceae bacterium]|mgnify:CR=1 FL=1|nr:DUF4124 domain-containing protein [Burkholderiaceae bacterium]
MSERGIAITVLLLTNAATVLAQSGALPSPSRIVYKCFVDGKASYSDSPCLGAQVVDISPTRGLDKMSGHKRVGHDISRESHRELIADALKPLTGMDAGQLKVAQRRQRLPASAQVECGALDRTISRREAIERSAAGDSLQSVQKELLAARKRFRALGC